MHRKVPEIGKPIALLASLILAALPATHAADWYVATDGSDSAAGTIEQPVATVQRAQNSAAPNDTVHIRGGITFGVFPALRASRLNPIDYLRYE